MDYQLVKFVTFFSLNDLYVAIKCKCNLLLSTYEFLGFIIVNCVCPI